MSTLGPCMFILFFFIYTQSFWIRTNTTCNKIETKGRSLVAINLVAAKRRYAYWELVIFPDRILMYFWVKYSSCIAHGCDLKILTYSIHWVLHIYRTYLVSWLPQYSLHTKIDIISKWEIKTDKVNRWMQQAISKLR